MRRTNPHGFLIEAIYGMQQLAPIDSGKTLPLNADGKRNRVWIRGLTTPIITLLAFNFAEMALHCSTRCAG